MLARLRAGQIATEHLHESAFVTVLSRRTCVSMVHKCQ
jgi:hypothetical protein